MLTGIDTTLDGSHIEDALEEMKSYTSEQLEEIKRINRVSIFGFPLKFPDEDKWIWTTEEGLQHQLDKFTTRTGLLYYISFKSGKFDISKLAVRKTWESVHGEKTNNED